MSMGWYAHQRCYHSLTGLFVMESSCICETPGVVRVFRIQGKLVSVVAVRSHHPVDVHVVHTSHSLQDTSGSV